MADESKSPKKGSITEEDAASPIQRYSLWTFFTLLQEVDRVAGDRIDWDELAKNTQTGISCAREYQKLWRRLSYGNTLEDQLDSDAEPMRRTSLTKKLINPTVGSSSQLSETELAAASGALPMDNTLNAVNKINTESTEPQVQPFNAPASQPDKQTSITEPSISQVPKKTPPMKHTTTADSVKAAAIAAGARIGTSTDASSLIEAARSQNVVRLKAATGFVMRRYRASTYRLPRHVHFFRGGLSKAPSSSYSAPVHSHAQADQPNPVGAARVLSVSSEKTNSTANIPSVELTKNEGTAGSTSGSGMRDVVQKDHINHQSDSPISVPVEQVPHNQPSESGESEYQASISSGDPGNDSLDAHVAMMQISEDDELGDEGVEVTSSNSMATTEDDDE